MINILALCLIHKIKQANCDTFSGEVPRYIGRQNSKGQVLYGDKYFEYIGLTDKKGNYFYIRLGGSAKENSFNKVNQFQYEITTPLRMVAVFQDYNAEAFNFKLTNDLLGIDLTTFDRRGRAKIEIASSSTDYETIYKAETGKAIKNWSGAFKMIAFDLNLKYLVDFDECLDLELCHELTYEEFVPLNNECDTLSAILARLKTLNND